MKISGMTMAMPMDYDGMRTGDESERTDKEPALISLRIFLEVIWNGLIITNYLRMKIKKEEMTLLQ